MRHRPVKVASLLCLALAACSICGRPRSFRLDSAELGRRLPRTARAQLVIPSLRRLSEKLARLESLKAASFAAQLQGFNSASEYGSALAAQIGIDLRSPVELAKLGIDPDQGAGAALLSDRSVLVVVAAKDPAKLRDAVAAFARDRWGAVAADASRNQVSFAVDRGIASIVLNSRAPTLAPPGQSSTASRLAEDASWVDAMKGLADGDAYLRVSGEWQIGSLLVSTATFALDFNRQVLRLRGLVPLPGESARALEKQEVADALVAALPDDAVLMARYTGQPQHLTSVLAPAWRDALQDAFSAAGINFRAEVLGNLRPGAYGSLSLAPSAVLSSVPMLDVRRTNPFRYFHLVAIGAVKDPAQANEVLRRIPGVAPKLGVQLSQKELAARQVFVTSYAQGEGLDFALIDGKLVVASPLKRLEETLERLSREIPGQASAPRSDLSPYLQRGAVDVVLDVNRLSASVRSLPSTAWGVGGFAIKAAMLRWLTALDDIRALTFTAGVARTPQAVEVELDLLLTGT